MCRFLQKLYSIERTLPIIVGSISALSVTVDLIKRFPAKNSEQSILSGIILSTCMVGGLCYPITIPGSVIYSGFILYRHYK